MTTPQNPGDGETPQDPSDPQNPYGTPPPPPSSAPPSSPPPTYPPTPPADPAGDPAAPAAPPNTPIPAAPPSNPVPPAYGDPNPTSTTPPAAPPAAPYGQPAAPPTQPAYGQPAYGQPAYGQYGAQAPAEPGKGMAIAALIIGFLGCTIIGALIAIPLAIVVLVRSRGGQNHGKGLAIAAIIVSILSLGVTVVGGYALYDFAKDFKNIDDLSAGDCITAKGLTDESETGVTQIKSVGCTAKHDGEVLATKTLTGAEADAYGDTAPGDSCAAPVGEAGSAALLADPALVVIALTEKSSPSSGDKLVCVIANADGSKLTSKLGS